MQSAFFVFLWYCSTRTGRCQHFFEDFCIFHPPHGTLRAYTVKKEVLNMAKNNQNKNQNQNQNQNQNKNGKNENQEQNKQAKECN